MDALTFVVEGKIDAIALRGILGAELAGSRFFAAGGRSSLATVARNLMVHEGTPIMIVKDADTHDLERVHEERMMLRVSLKHVAPEIPMDVFEFVPELEVIFLETPDILDRIQPGLSADKSFMSAGRLAPKQALVSIWKKPLIQALGDITEDEWASIRRGSQASAFVSAVRQLRMR